MSDFIILPVSVRGPRTKLLEKIGLSDPKFIPNPEVTRIFKEEQVLHFQVYSKGFWIISRIAIKYEKRSVS